MTRDYLPFSAWFQWTCQWKLRLPEMKIEIHELESTSGNCSWKFHLLSDELRLCLFSVEAEMRSQLLVGAAFAFGVELAHMRNYICLLVSHQHLMFGRCADGNKCPEFCCHLTNWTDSCFGENICWSISGNRRLTMKRGKIGELYYRVDSNYRGTLWPCW